MNLRFKHVTAKNFLSFKKLDFDIGCFDGKTVLITGFNDDIQGESSKQNGAGKSTLNNTILFALYGEVLNPLKKATSIRNWSADVSPKDDVEVVLTLDSNGKEYAIQRILKGKKCAQELHVFSRAKSDEEFVEVTLSTIAETQRMIETDIVPCSKEGFLRCVILTADQNYNFFKLNKAAKNSFFESLFELTKYSDMYAKLHRMTLDETSNQTALSRTIDNLNSNIIKLEADKENAKKNQTDIINAKKDVETIGEELKKFEDEVSLSKVVETKEAEYSEYKKNEVSVLKEKMMSFDKENDIASVDDKHNIVFDTKFDSSLISKKTEEYDASHGLKLNTDGNIEFDDASDGYSEAVEKYNAISSRITNGQKLVKELESDISEKTRTIRSKNSELSSIESRITSMKSSLKAHSKITDILCDDCIVKYKKSVDISEFDSEIEKLGKDVVAIKSDIETEKTALEQIEAKKTKFMNALSELNDSLYSTKGRISEIKTARNNIRSERESFINSVRSSIRTAHSELQLKRNELRNSLVTEYKEKCFEFEKLINSEKTKISNARLEIERRLKNAECKLKILSESKNETFDAPIKSLNESLEKTKSEFDDSTETITHYKALEEILKPDNIRKSVVPDMLKELNFRICGYLAKMGSNYTCKFDDDFEATFISNTGTEAEYNNFSSGEKMRLSIACCLAFRDFMQVRLNFHPNMLIIDEFIDSNLDAMAVSGIMDMIHYMVGTEKISAFIISHRSEIKQDVFDSEILIRKKNDDSKIIVDGIELNPPDTL